MSSADPRKARHERKPSLLRRGRDPMRQNDVREADPREARHERRPSLLGRERK